MKNEHHRKAENKLYSYLSLYIYIKLLDTKLIFVFFKFYGTYYILTWSKYTKIPCRATCSFFLLFFTKNNLSLAFMRHLYTVYYLKYNIYEVPNIYAKLYFTERTKSDTIRLTSFGLFLN